MLRHQGALCLAVCLCATMACSDSLPNTSDGSSRGDSVTSPDLSSDASSGCQGAPNGQPCGDGRICASSQCALSICGDGFVDKAAGEECDDENLVPFDGCEPLSCAFTCKDNQPCDDHNLCNGLETCSLDSHTCQEGLPLKKDDPCSTSSDEDGLCRPNHSGVLFCVDKDCGNHEQDTGEECDDGNDVNDDGCDNDCTYSCGENAHCDNGVFCDGTETCHLASHTCSEGTKPTCKDGDDCTKDTCDSDLDRCINPLIDGDEDGHAPEELGPCGTDCDDTRGDVNPDQPEVCDDTDHNCDGQKENEKLFWYIDCDEDGYAQHKDDRKEQCEEPSSSETGCGGGWTTRLPEDLGTTDCKPMRGDVNPGQTAYSAEPIENPPPGGKFDYNCDQEQERRYPKTAGTCSYKPPKNLPCNPDDFKCWCYRNADACFGTCGGTEGWSSTTIPACGISGDYKSCNTVPTLCNFAKPTLGCQLHCLGNDLRCCNPKDSDCDVSCVPRSRGCDLWCQPNTPGCAWVSLRCTSSGSARTQTCR